MLTWNQWRWSLWVWMHLVTCLFSYNLLDILQTFCSWCKSKIYTFCKTWYRGKRLILVVLDVHVSPAGKQSWWNIVWSIYTDNLIKKLNKHDFFNTSAFWHQFVSFRTVSNWTSILIEIYTFTFNVHYNVLNNGVSMFKTGSISNYWW